MSRSGCGMKLSLLAQPANERLIKLVIRTAREVCIVIYLSSFRVIVDSDLFGHMHNDLSARFYINRVKRVALALIQPVRNFVQPAGDRIVSSENSRIPCQRLGRTSKGVCLCGKFGVSFRLRVRTGCCETDSLGEVAGCVGDALISDTRNAKLVREPGDRLGLRGPRFRKSNQSSVLEGESHALDLAADTGESPVALGNTGHFDAVKARDFDSVRGQIFRSHHDLKGIWI